MILLASWETAIRWTVGMLPFVGLAFAILYAGHVSYANARERERRANEPPRADPIVELSRVNVEIAETLGRARRTLEETQATLQRGIRG